MINTAVTLPRPLLKRALAKARDLYGNRRFSQYVREVLTRDLAKKQ